MLLALLLYLAFFGWVGWRRGTFRELAVLVTAGASWYVLQAQGDLFVRIANLGGKTVAFFTSGGLSDDPTAGFEAIRSAPNVITGEMAPIFLFLLWVLILVSVYIISNLYITVDYQDGWSILLGIANGLLLGAILLPRLLAPLVPGISAADFLAQTRVRDVLSGTLDILRNGLSTIWEVIEPQASVVFLLLITLLLLLAATSLRRANANEG